MRIVYEGVVSSFCAHSEHPGTTLLEVLLQTPDGIYEQYVPVPDAGLENWLDGRVRVTVEAIPATEARTS